jgi:HD-GYP domain-containing protein (c-di-GMP phosphodiesterase class II)
MNRLRLLYVLFLVLVLVTVVPSVVSNLLVTGMLRDNLETQERKYQTRTVVSLSQEIKDYVGRYRAQLDRVADAVGLASEMAPGQDVFAALGPRLGRYIEEDPRYRTLLVLNPQGQGAGAQPPGLPEEVIGGLRAALAKTLQGQKVVGDVFYLDSLNETVILLTTPIMVRGQTQGAVEALVSLQPIYESLKERGSDAEMAYLVDGKGRVVLHSSASATISRPDYARVPIVKSFIDKPIRLTTSYDFSEVGGSTRVLGTVAPVGEPDWGVVVQKEEAAAFRSVSAVVNRTLLIGAAALLAAVIVGYFLSRAISGPITRLADTSMELAKGNFKVRAGEEGSKEISALGGSFNHMAAQIEAYIDRLVQAAQENRDLFVSSIRMIATAIDAKDPYTRGHSDRVCAYSMAVAREMGWKGAELEEVRVSAMLHDVGKIGIDDRVLRKPSALNDEEFAMIKSHPFTGSQIMEPVPQLKNIIPGIKYHHENWGGGGYPEGLKGEEIPRIARIIAVGDTFDAMTTDRPYQKAMSARYAAEKIRSLVGKRFEPAVVEAFLRAFEKGDIRVETDKSHAA